MRQPARFPSEEAPSELLLRSSLLRRETMPAQSSTDFLIQSLRLGQLQEGGCPRRASR